MTDLLYEATENGPDDTGGLQEELASLRAQLLSEQQYREEVCALIGGYEDKPGLPLFHRVSRLKRKLDEATAQAELMRKVAADAEERCAKLENEHAEELAKALAASGEVIKQTMANEQYRPLCDALVRAGNAAGWALERYGYTRQSRKCTEEMGEAIAELSREESNRGDLLGELADVVVTMMAVVHNAGIDEFAAVLDAKAAALLVRLGE